MVGTIKDVGCPTHLLLLRCSSLLHMELSGGSKQDQNDTNFGVALWRVQGVPRGSQRLFKWRSAIKDSHTSDISKNLD
jgi:hypothetical protein